LNTSLLIVLADDVVAVRCYLKSLLLRLGHQVAAASDGKELVEMAQDIQPDLLITDVNMPGLDGIQAAAVVNRDRVVPTILITGDDAAETWERADMPYIVACLQKPVGVAELEEAVALGAAKLESTIVSAGSMF